MGLKSTPAQAKRIRRLARKACCNCYHGDCLLLDDGESHRCAVLPAEKELCSEIYNLNEERKQL